MAWEVKWCAQGHRTSTNKAAIQDQVWFQMQSSTATLRVIFPKNISDSKSLHRACAPKPARTWEMSSWVAIVRLTFAQFHQSCPPASEEPHAQELLSGQRQFWEGSAGDWASKVYFSTLALGNSINSAVPQWDVFPRKLIHTPGHIFHLLPAQWLSASTFLPNLLHSLLKWPS